ncbi:hypothetical protein FE257_007694 [Aspergillus nanangensis]|uniref:Autophagy-related protein 14 n=1 Tax=Aspergillus nanangensis TaxID=2582783 RepID=A0AAD4GYN7_ASPNN|nr:hypothetical protein FE257_007694 [Aspergillus nanangensis]
MSCHVCSRAPTSRLRFFCPSCARNRLYQLRIQHATVLLEKESIGSQIEASAACENASNTPPDTKTRSTTKLENESSIALTVQAITNEQAKSSARIESLLGQVEALGRDIKSKRHEVSQRKLALRQRYTDAESAKYQIDEREATTLASIQNNTKRTDHLWHSLHSKTAEDRIFLCREAASLYGLRQKARKTDGAHREVYTIGGSTPAQVSTSVAYIAHLLVLVSHYLSLRLPAEITLPHRNYPTPTIYPLAGSYLNRDPSPAHPFYPQPTSPVASRTVDSRSPLPRPRPLYFERPLAKLVREDPAAYALFLEGVTLLAWNVSWVCRTQGLNLASDSWEEVCDIGKNMWQLLVAPPAQASTLTRAFAGRDIQTKMKLAKDSPKTTIQRTKSFPMLGHYSHGTVHSFLGASDGTEFMRSWRLPAPTKITDKLKSSLLGEMASAEWELLEKREWDDIPQEPAVDSSIHKGDTKNDQVSLTNADGSDLDDDQREASGEPISSNRLRGTSGWTKLRHR